MDRERTQTAPRILGITGPIGCGKTTVGDILLELGALARIDADAVVHELMFPGSETTAEIAQQFGQDVLRPDGSIDRALLGQRVFADSRALQQLEAIVHPQVRAAIRERIADLTGHEGVVIVDAVKLLQSELLPLVEAVWVVQCPRAEELRRLVEVRGMTRADAAARIDAQPMFEHPRVTRVIENDGGLDALRVQVREAWQEFQNRARE